MSEKIRMDNNEVFGNNDEKLEISKETLVEIKKEENNLTEDSSNPFFNLLKDLFTKLEKSNELPENWKSLLPLSEDDDNSINGNNELSNNEMEMDWNGDQEDDETNDEWHVEFKKLDRESYKMDKREEERRRQMAKNREYARKCVQKKKDMRKQAELRSLHISKRIQLQQKYTSIKERNGNFAVELRRMMNENGVDDQKKMYEGMKKALNQKYDEMFAEDETVNLNFHRLSSAREEYEKAAEDLKQKNGVIGTLGSRKIRAKQQMEWRQHLYSISVNEHKHRREMKLAELADDYVRRTVPTAAPLVQSIPKNMLDQLIKNSRLSELEEFCRFVAENSNIFHENDKNNDDVDFNESKESVVK